MRLSPSRVNAQTEVGMVTDPSLVLKFRGTAEAAEPSNWLRNFWGSGWLSPDRMEVMELELLASTGPKSSMAALLARRMMPPGSTRKAGQTALSSNRATSSLVVKVVIVIRGYRAARRSLAPPRLGPMRANINAFGKS